MNHTHQFTNTANSHGKYPHHRHRGWRLPELQSCQHHLLDLRKGHRMPRSLRAIRFALKSRTFILWYCIEAARSATSQHALIYIKSRAAKHENELKLT